MFGAGAEGARVVVLNSVRLLCGNLLELLAELFIGLDFSRRFASTYSTFLFIRKDIIFLSAFGANKLEKAARAPPVALVNLEFV